MDMKRWNTKQKLIASATFVGFYLFLKLNGLGAIVNFLLVGAIPGTKYSLSAGSMLIFYGVAVWMIFCHRTAIWALRRFAKNHSATSPLATHLPRRRYGELS